MFEVVWERSALDELAAIWVAAAVDDRGLLTAAADAIDPALAASPDDVGESRPDGTRVHFEWPLGIRFDVDHPNQTVRVLQVWRVRG